MIRLKQHLGGLLHNGIVQAFDDRKIPPGTEWDDQIKRELENAHVVLFLISPSFLDSSYINKVEVQTAIERHNAHETVVFPIALKPCSWKGTPFSHIKGLPEQTKPIVLWQNQDLAFQEIAEAIYEHSRKMTHCFEKKARKNNNSQEYINSENDNKNALIEINLTAISTNLTISNKKYSLIQLKIY